MKIAILSMQRVVNFGSVLQAYSLRELIREVTGHTPCFLDIEDTPCLESCRTVVESVDYDAAGDYPPGLLQKGKRRIITWLSGRNKGYIRAFMEQELKLSSRANQETYDYVVVGSDEVFNHRKGICLQLHGRIPQGKRLFTYAASCGSALAEDVALEDAPAIREAMAHYRAVSVRDGGTQRYVRTFYDGPIEHHLDPVLVGPLPKRQPQPVRLKHYLLVYAYGQRIRTREEIQAIRAYAQKKGLKTVAMGGSQFWCDLYLPTDPMGLMDYFYGADCVVTDTFHGTIFSVIHHKPFALIGRQTNRNKLTGLLEDLGLQDRLLTRMADLDRVLSSPIDYEAVEQILEQERARSREYLKKMLEVES